ncbi:MAG: hypothetical protein QM831_36960 [Kofleriaceae bacterium]
MKLYLLALLVTAGCALDEMDLGEADQDIATSNKLAANKLAANKLAANKLAANKLASAAFANSDSGPLINTADGRDVLTYMISCALPAGQSITLTDSTGAAWSFAGSIGVAPAWSTRALTLDEQRWETGCVLGRVNYFGVKVDLSMRGNNAALAITSADATYTELDGIFYGNLFDSSGPKEYACDGRAGNPTRVCADVSSDGVTTMCGFTYTGMCTGAGTASACTGAMTAPTCKTPTPTTTPFTQTVLVYLQKT